MRYKKTVATILMSLLAAATPAQAQPVDGITGWQTWTWDGSCFALLFPENPVISQLGNKRAYTAIKHTPSESTFDSVSFVSGLDDMTGVKGTADIDGKTFSLLVYDGSGFVSSGPREQDLLASMLRGEELKITWSGPEAMVTQVYKLPGLEQAKRTIDAGCSRPDA
jgi:hypothetical protein